MVPARSSRRRPPSLSMRMPPAARNGPGSMAATRNRYQCLAHLRPVEAEDLHRHAELEGAQAVVGQRHHQAVVRGCGLVGALARSLRSLAFVPLVAYHRAGVKCARSKHPAQSAGDPRHAEPCHRHAARAALRRGQALRPQAGARDRLLGRARDLEEAARPTSCCSTCAGPPPTPRRTCRARPACRTRDITAERMMAWPHDTLFVVYCAGPHCNGADRAALKLSQPGPAGEGDAGRHDRLGRRGLPLRAQHRGRGLRRPAESEQGQREGR